MPLLQTSHPGFSVKKLVLVHFFSLCATKKPTKDNFFGGWGLPKYTSLDPVTPHSVVPNAPHPGSGARPCPEGSPRFPPATLSLKERPDTPYSSDAPLTLSLDSSPLSLMPDEFQQTQTILPRTFSPHWCSHCNESIDRVVFFFHLPKYCIECQAIIRYKYM